MSDWAWQQRCKGPQKLVLLCLANRHNAQTHLCYPSVLQISEDTGLDKKTVPSAIKALEELKLISVERRHRKAAHYFFNVSPAESLPPENGYQDNGGRDALLPENGCQSAAPRGDLLEPENGCQEDCLLPENGDQTTPENGYQENTQKDALTTRKRVSTYPENGCQHTPKTGTQPGSNRELTGNLNKLGASPDPPRKKSRSKKTTSTLPDFPALKKLSFDGWPGVPSEEVWQGVLALRRKKKAPLSPIVLRSLRKTVIELGQHGWTVNEILMGWCKAGWTGLEPAWFVNRYGSPKNISNPVGSRVIPAANNKNQHLPDDQRSTRDMSLGELLQDTSWAE